MMNRKIFIIVLIFIYNIGYSQNIQDCYEDAGQKMCVVKNNGLYGVIDKKGNFIVPANFDTIEIYDKAFIVLHNDKFGLYDRKGNIIIPVEYSSIRKVENDKNDFLFEVNNDGVKSVFITKEIDRVSGMNKISPTILAGISEVSIKEWFAYVSYVKENGNNYEETLPDTNKVEAKLLPVYRAFLKGLVEDENMVETKTGYGFYYSWKITHYYDASFDKLKKNEMVNFPITGISYNQSVKYVEWLTSIYKNEVNNDQDNGFDIVFRLPKASEWESMAIGGLNEKMKPNQCLDSTNIKGCMLLNFNATEKCSNYEDYLKNSYGVGSSFVFSFFPDYNGIYNVFGNVAEMVQENGLAKGGSYHHFAKEAKASNTIKYNDPQPWLGLRVIAEFKTKED